MKKITILAAGLALSAPAFSQVSFSVSPEAGVNIANMHERYKDGSGQTKNNNGGIKYGVRAGANLDIWFNDRVSIQPALFYAIKGAKFDDDATFGGVTQSYENNITLHYFDIPVEVEYYFNDPGEGRLFVGGGAYISTAFSGKDKASSTYTNGAGVTTKTDTVISYKFGDDYYNNNLRRFDFGVTGNLGYLLRSGIFFRGSYQYGITNLVPHANRPSSLDDEALRHQVFTISVGYKLGGGNKARNKKSSSSDGSSM